MMEAESLVQKKINESNEIISQASLSEMAKAVFTITSKQFLKDLAHAAIQDPQRYHHLYEWLKVGNTRDKLFLMRRKTIRGGSLEIEFVPMRSTKPVPISPELLIPGPTGKVVSSQNIFRDKMQIMESGKPIHYVTKSKIVFPLDDSLVFVGKGKVIDIMNPGGERTTNALGSFAQNWYAVSAPAIVNQSRFMRQIANEAAKVMNGPDSSPQKVRSAIKKVSAAYSKEVTTI